MTNDLFFTGLTEGGVLIERPAALRQSQNATRDKLETDGSMQVLLFKNQ